VAPAFVPIFAAHERSRPPHPAARWLLGDLQGRLSQPALHQVAAVSLSKPDPGSDARRDPKAVAVLQKR
jgi:hypothetical protein